MGRTTVADSSTRSVDQERPADPAERGLRVLVLLGSLGHRTHEALVEQFEDLDVVGNAQVLAICELALRGTLRPKDLQAAAGLTSGGTTKLLDHLEQLGLIERAYGQVDGDRRGIAVSLTPHGRDAASRMSATIDARIDAVREFNVQLARLVEA